MPTDVNVFVVFSSFDGVDFNPRDGMGDKSRCFQPCTRLEKLEIRSCCDIPHPVRIHFNGDNYNALSLKEMP